MRRGCAGVVLHRPDVAVLARQIKGLDGVRLLAFANGELEDEVVVALASANLYLESNPANLGLACGLNSLMARASLEGFTDILLLDQDSEPNATTVADLIHHAQGSERDREGVAVIAARLVPPQDGFYKPVRYAFRGSPRTDGLAAVDYAPTSGSLVSLAAYSQIGPFRDDFFIGGIDIEWGFRAWSKGWASYIVPAVTMTHRWGEPVSGDEIGKPQILRHAPIRNYYYTRNAIATARLPHIPLSWRIRSCVALAGQIGLLALKGSPGALRPIAAGLRDGFKGRLGPAPHGSV